MTADDLLAALRAEGMRITSARAALCEVLAAEPDDHHTALELRTRAEALTAGRIDPSTVYRTIEVLQGLGLVDHVHTGQGTTVVHLVEEPHHHLSCRVCGKFVDIPAADALAALRSVSERHGFAADTLHFALVGTCEDCVDGAGSADPSPIRDDTK